MNNDRRKRIAQAQLEISSALMALESVAEDEQEAFDNMPEGLQNSEKGERVQELLDLLNAAIEGINDAQSQLDEVTE